MVELESLPIVRVSSVPHEPTANSAANATAASRKEDDEEAIVDLASKLAKPCLFLDRWRGMDGCGMCVAIDVVAGRCVFMGVGGKQFRHGRTVSPIDRWLACLSADTCSIATNRSGLGIPGCLAVGQKKCRTCRPLRNKAWACNPQRF